MYDRMHRKTLEQRGIHVDGFDHGETLDSVVWYSLMTIVDIQSNNVTENSHKQTGQTNNDVTWADVVTTNHDHKS